MLTACFHSPVGALTVFEADGAITSLRWAKTESAHTALLDQAVTQLAAYFAGELQNFDLPLNVKGSEFLKAVCVEMQKIPYGETCTYGDIAKTLGVAAQPVGGACGANPIPVIIPCHRVMGADGKLTGFSGAGGVETKVALLRHEGAGGFLL